MRPGIAFDGPAAIAAANLQKPDVVLLDLSLPGMSGIEVAAELRRDPERSAMCRSSPSPATARTACRPHRRSTAISRSRWRIDALLAYLAGIERPTPTVLAAAVA